MPVPSLYTATFEENGIYHVYNRTNNFQPLFLNDENRLFFLTRYKTFISPVADTYCWNLLPNHFHLMIKVKSMEAISLSISNNETLTITERKFIENKIPLHDLVVKSFQRFFQSYSIAFNDAHNKKGNLFYKSFKRVRIDKDSQFTMALIYIHANSMKHRLVKDFTQYKWSSWHSILSDKPTSLLRKELIDWFGDLDTFIKVHREMSDYYYYCDVALED